MPIHAFVMRKRGANHGDTHHPHGSIIKSMSDGQFRDWSGADIVREATAAEIGGGQPKPKAPAKPKRVAKPRPKPIAKKPTPPAPPPAIVLNPPE